MSRVRVRANCCIEGSPERQASSMKRSGSLGSEPRSRPRNRISNGALNAARLSEVDDAELRGVRDSVGSAGGVELVEKRTDMKLDGMN